MSDEKRIAIFFPARKTTRTAPFVLTADEYYKALPEN
jgi:hypothetical protein